MRLDREREEGRESKGLWGRWDVDQLSDPQELLCFLFACPG
jgi:hypothetical protein